MKLRFRGNTLRLRVNQSEVKRLAAGKSIQEEVIFPDRSHFKYIFEPGETIAPQASFQAGAIHVTAPLTQVQDWAQTEMIGLYFDLKTEGPALRVSIEKDLECTDGTPEEHDPDAFPRLKRNNC